VCNSRDGRIIAENGEFSNVGTMDAYPARWPVGPRPGILC